MIRLLASILVVPFLAGWTSAQTLLRIHDASYPYDTLGRSVAGIGDVDQDGSPDYVVGAATAHQGGPSGPQVGSVTAFSGRTGAVLWTTWGPHSFSDFGVSVAGVGDVNGDGIPDVAVGADGDSTTGTEAGSVWVYDGRTGTELFHVYGLAPHDRFGWAVAGAGDVNGDGYADVIAGVEQPQGTLLPGYATILLGPTGSNSIVIQGAGASAFGFSVTGIGDINGDGRSDVAIGAPYYSDSPYYQNGRVQIYSISQAGIPVLLATLHAPILHNADNFGLVVAGPGDCTGDGYPDIVVASQWYHGAIFNAGYVWVYSGANPTAPPVHTFQGYSQEHLGKSVQGAGDINGDGTKDLIVGTVAGPVHVYSGGTWNELFTLFPGDAGSNFGIAVAGIGDIDGDNISDLIVGANGNNAGTAWVFSGGFIPMGGFCFGDGTGAVDCASLGAGCSNGALGHGCANSVFPAGAVLGAAGMASLSNDTLTFYCSQLPPNASCLFIQGTAPAQTAFGDGILCVGHTIVRLGHKVASATGEARFGAGIPGDPPISIAGQLPGPGATRFYQDWYRNPASFCSPASFNLSNGYRVTWLP